MFKNIKKKLKAEQFVVTGAISGNQLFAKIRFFANIWNNEVDWFQCTIVSEACPKDVVL